MGVVMGTPEVGHSSWRSCPPQPRCTLRDGTSYWKPISVRASFVQGPSLAPGLPASPSLSARSLCARCASFCARYVHLLFFVRCIAFHLKSLGQGSDRRD